MMNINDFKSIIETRNPKVIQSRLVSPQEARAVISNYEKLTEPYRGTFMELPITNIIEISICQKNPPRAKAASKIM